MLGIDFVLANQGPDTAEAVALHLPLPTGVDWVSGAGECTASAGAVVCSFGDLAASDSRTRSLYLRPSAAGLLTLDASLTSNTADPDGSDNQASVTVDVVAVPPPPPPSGEVADLVLTRFKSTTRTPRVGRAAGFQFILKNLGADPAVDTRFVVPIPAGMSWVSGPSECSNDGAELVCSFGDLAAGASRNRYFYLRPAAAGGYTLDGSVVSDTSDTNAVNNGLAVSIEVLP